MLRNTPAREHAVGSLIVLAAMLLITGLLFRSARMPSAAVLTPAE